MHDELMTGKDFIMQKYSKKESEEQKVKEYFLQAELMNRKNKIVLI